MCKNQIAQGLWHRYEKTEHIHYLEREAAFYLDLHNCSILLPIDNTTAYVTLIEWVA